MATGSRRYGGIPADLRRTQRKDKLLAATVQLLGDIGAEHLTVQRIVAVAGLSSRSLYESFSGLDELVEAAFRHAAQQFAAAIKLGAPASVHDRESQMTAIVEAIVDFALRRPEALVLLSAHRTARSEAAGQPSLESTPECSSLAAFVDRQLTSATRSGPPGAFTAEFIAAGIAASTTAWIRDPQGRDRIDFIREIAGLTSGAIAADDDLRGPEIAG